MAIVLRDPTKVKWEEFDAIAVRNPILSAYLMMYREEKCSLPQALEATIFSLIEVTDEQYAVILKLREESTISHGKEVLTQA